mgnify:CR=1 FL=1
MSNKRPLNIEIKKINKTNIYKRVLSGEELTKQELAADLQLCIPTVAKNIEGLLDAGLIAQSGSKGNTGGRNAVAYSLVNDARAAIGIEITGNHVSMAALDLLGNIIASHRLRIPFSGSEAYFRDLGSLFQELVEKAGLTGQQILGVGIGLPALVDIDRKTILFSKIIDLERNVYQQISAYIPYRVELFNDANAAAFTEIWKDPDRRNAFYLMLSNNIGGCFVLDDIVYTGATQKAGEVGHMTLIPDGQKCYCGQKGCVENYLTAKNLSNLAEGSLQDFFAGLESGNREYSRAWDKYLGYLALTVNTVHALLDCDIILGGYVGGYLDAYMEDLRERVAALNSFGDNAGYLRTCVYKKTAIASGAALNFIGAFNAGI